MSACTCWSRSPTSLWHAASTTDIAAARAVGARSVLMLTGVTGREAVDAVAATERPTEIAADAAELAAALDRLSG